MGKKSKKDILRLFREELDKNEIPPDDVVGIVGQILSEYKFQVFMDNTRSWPLETSEREEGMPKKTRGNTSLFFRQELKENEILPEVVGEIMGQILAAYDFQVIRISSQEPPPKRKISDNYDCEPATPNSSNNAVQTRSIKYRRKECAAFHQKIGVDLP